MALIIGHQLLPADLFVALRIKWSEEQTSALKGNLALRQVPFFSFLNRPGFAGDSII